MEMWSRIVFVGVIIVHCHVIYENNLHIFPAVEMAKRWWTQTRSLWTELLIAAVNECNVWWVHRLNHWNVNPRAREWGESFNQNNIALPAWKGVGGDLINIGKFTETHS